MSLAVSRRESRYVPGRRLLVQIPTKAATYSNLIAATIPI
jgi:hypothetical protein